MTKSLIATGLVLAAGTAASALTYSNGPLSTGPLSGATAAPAGTTWSEVQPGNTIAGYANQSSAGNRVADDFVVGAGGWNITSIRFFGYQTGGSSVSSSFTGLNFRIGSGAGTGTVFGDTTTNRLSSSSFANMFRIFNVTPGTTRPIYNLDCNIGGGGLNLAAGTYWLDWAALGSLASGPWAPNVTIVGQQGPAGANGMQSIANGAFAAVTDGTNLIPQAFAFEITYTVIPAPGAAALFGLAGLAGIRRRR